MNTSPPLLPEATFKKLSPNTLEAMIDHAVSYSQLPRRAQVITFRSRTSQLAFGTGMAAMAASIMLAFMFTPQYSLTTSLQATSSHTQLQTADSSDVGDLLLLDSLGA